jgi:hypothetical protein
MKHVVGQRILPPQRSRRLQVWLMDMTLCDDRLIRKRPTAAMILGIDRVGQSPVVDWRTIFAERWRCPALVVSHSRFE